MDDEVAQDVEHLRAEGDTPARAAQFTPARVKRILTKEILHGAGSSAWNDSVLRTHRSADSHESTTKIPHLCHQFIMFPRSWRCTFSLSLTPVIQESRRRSILGFSSARPLELAVLELTEFCQRGTNMQRFV